MQDWNLVGSGVLHAPRDARWDSDPQNDRLPVYVSPSQARGSIPDTVADETATKARLFLPLYHRFGFHPDHRAHRFRPRTRGRPLRDDPLRPRLVPLVPPRERRLPDNLRSHHLLHVRLQLPVKELRC